MNSIKDILGDTLYVEPYPLAPGFARNSSTSRAAAHSMKPHYTVQQKVIMEWLKERGATGATYSEIVSGTGLSIPSVCARMVELVHGQHVIKSEHTRATSSGRQARVYVHKEEQP